MKHFICSKDLDCELLMQVSLDEYKILKRFYKDFEKFSILFDFFNNFSVSKNDLEVYLIEMEASSEINFSDTFSRCKYLLINNIVSGRQLMDNTRSFSSQIGRTQFETIVNLYETKNEIKMMKYLRDFSNHYSLPIDDIKMTTYITKTQNKQQISLVVSKKTLEKNKKTLSKNKEYLLTVSEEYIDIISYFSRWSELLDLFFKELLIEFCKLIPKYESELILKYFDKPISKNSKTYFPNAITKNNPILNNVFELNGKKYSAGYSTIELFRFDRRVLDKIIEELKKG